MKGPCGKQHRQPKHIPYGSQLGVYWCRGCDRALVPDYYDKPRKRTARQAAKQEIRAEAERCLKKKGNK